MVPCIEILHIVREGFQFLRGVVTDIQLYNLMMIGTAVILHCKFNLSSISRSWLKKKSVNAFSHCLMYAKFNLDEAIQAYSRMLRNSYELSGGRFIIDDTMNHHSNFCKFIYGVFWYWDHAFKTNVSAVCLVFLYYSQDGFIKFPIGWRIYIKGGNKTKNDLAIELIEEGLRRDFPCGVVLADSWYCVAPFIRELQRLELKYVCEIKTNVTVRVPLKKRAEKRRGRKRTKWYKTENIVTNMKRIRKERVIGFCGDLESGKEEKVLYKLKVKVCMINSLPGTHKIIYSYDPERGTEKYLITNALTWEGVKVVKEYFHRWVIEEFFRNAKQQLNMEGASVRSGQGAAIKLFLVSCVDSLFHMEIAKLVSMHSKSEPITVQSITRLAELENVEKLVELIKSPKGNGFLKRWAAYLKENAIRKRKVKSDVVYLDQEKAEGGKEKLPKAS